MSTKSVTEGHQPNKHSGGKSEQRNDGYQPKKVPIPPTPTRGSSAVPPKTPKK